MSTRRRTPRIRETAAKKLNISPSMLNQRDGLFLTLDEIKAKYAPAATLGAPEEVRTAQDAALDSCGAYSLIQHSMETSGAYAAPEFLGYGYLTGLTQNPLIRVGVEMIADEMTRNWIRLTSNTRADAEGDDKEKIAKLAVAMRKFGARRLIHDAAAMTLYFGGCLIYIDTGADGADLNTDLYLDRAVFPQGALKGFRLIEPYNVAPGVYATNNTLSRWYYKPRSWWIQGTEVAASRVLRVAINLPPTLLLPAYNFFGIPLAQIVLDPINHFTECRESVARLLNKFSLTVFKTNMSEILQGGAADMMNRRIQYLVQNRNNDGVEAIDMESEDIVKLETPLGGLTDIVRQCMEIVAAYFGEPAVKLWGISPNGFNATGDSDMQNHYDHVASQQERMLREPLEAILRVLQMDLFGEIDDSISFEFEPLGKEDERAAADVNKVKADTTAVFFDRGIISAEEARKVLADDPKSGYNDIDPDDVPEDPNQEGGEADIAAMMNGMGGSRGEGEGSGGELNDNGTAEPEADDN